jgi:hypothetical protein
VLVLGGGGDEAARAAAEARPGQIVIDLTRRAAASGPATPLTAAAGSAS